MYSFEAARLLCTYNDYRFMAYENNKNYQKVTCHNYGILEFHMMMDVFHNYFENVQAIPTIVLCELEERVYVDEALWYIYEKIAQILGSLKNETPVNIQEKLFETCHWVYELLGWTKSKNIIVITDRVKQKLKVLLMEKLQTYIFIRSVYFGESLMSIHLKRSFVRTYESLSRTVVVQ